MGKKYRTFSYEFKKDLVEQIESGALSVNEAAREHDISSSLVSYWVRQDRAGRLVSKPTAREKQLEKELEQYKKKVGELTLANDFLKKAIETSRRTRKLNTCVVTQDVLDQSKERAK